MDLDQAQKDYLLGLLLKEQERMQSTLRFTLFEPYKSRVERKAALIDQTIEQLSQEVDNG